MRILVTSSVCLNGGDAAIGLATLRQLKLAFGNETEVDFADVQPDVARQLYPDLSFVPQLQRLLRAADAGGRRGSVRRRLLVARLDLAATLGPRRPRLPLSTEERNELQRYRSYDLLLSSGGTNLVETYIIWPRLAEIRIAQRLGLPVVLFTQSLGPFIESSNRRQMRAILRQAALVLVRDERSARHVSDLGGDPVQVEDVVFALPAPTSATPRDEVIVSVREWRHVAGGENGMRRYEAAVAEGVTSIVRTHGYGVRFASTCQGVPEYTTDDSSVAARIRGLLEPDVAARVVLDRAFHRPEELQELLAAAPMAVCTRMHMAILALTVRTPVLAIAYEFKTTELFRRLGRAEDALDIDVIEGAEVVRGIERVLARGPVDIAERAESANSSYRLLRRALPQFAV